MTQEEFFSIRKKIIESEFSSLNNMQKKAVYSTEGPLLVLAGAGSGKTTVLVNRVYNLIKYGCAYYDTTPVNTDNFTPYEIAMLNAAANGVELPPDLADMLPVDPVKPWQILAITFTNKAAGELKERLVSLVGPEADDIWASTFHSACVKILRKNASYIGYTSNFTIYDTDDSKRVIKDCIKKLGLNDKIIQPKQVLYEISNAKDYLISPEDYISEHTNQYEKENIGRVFQEYQKALKSSDAMDFDDLILNTVLLFKNNPEILDYYCHKFRYILVDEYQDTNHMQYLLVSLLASKHRNICVVGDEDQSIYKFRGATIENILSFEKEYSNSKVIKLEQNYRSTQNILDSANEIIANNNERIGKNLWTSNGEGDKITLHTAETDRDEGYFVVNNINRLRATGKNFSDFAVLYRMNAQSNLVESALIRSAIPYRIIGGHKFYDRKEIKDAIAYLSVIVNPDDSVRLFRIINEPKRGIGDTTIAAIKEISEALEMGVFEVISNAADYPKLSRSVNKLTAFAETINRLIEFSENNSASALLTEILYSTGYIDSLDAEPERKQDRLENLDQLINNIKNYETENEGTTLNDFLQEVSLMTDIDNYNSESDSVVLMTVHSAKGLEFDTVFLVGMEESVFPSDLDGEEGMEEERRLCYVAVTRAKKNLFISNCRQRVLFGMTRYNPRSRFIAEISPEHTQLSVENQRENKANKQKTTYVSGESRKPDSKISRDYGFSGVSKPKEVCKIKFKVGDTVIHNTYGEGVILSVTPMGNDSMLEVAFIQGMTKKIMANFAKIQLKA